MLLLARYAHIPPSESDQLTEPQARQLLEVVDSMVADERKHDREFLTELVLGSSKLIADTMVRAMAVMARG